MLKFVHENLDINAYIWYNGQQPQFQNTGNGKSVKYEPHKIAAYAANDIQHAFLMALVFHFFSISSPLESRETSMFDYNHALLCGKEQTLADSIS